METIVKFDVRKMKADIKVKVEEQLFYKLQRKSNIPNSDRNIPAREAQWKHKANRHILRLMYAAYGLARDKSFSQTENHYPEDNHPLKQYQGQIDSTLNNYKLEVEIEKEGV